jgi:hypothetical protein
MSAANRVVTDPPTLAARWVQARVVPTMTAIWNEEELRRRLLLASAQLVIGEIQADEVVMLACDLVAEGTSGEATLELAIQSPAQLGRNHAGALLRQMLAEWEIDAPAQQQSAELVAFDLCRRLLDGTLAPETAGHRLLGALTQSVNPARADRLLRLLDRLEYDLGGRADEQGFCKVGI